MRFLAYLALAGLCTVLLAPSLKVTLGINDLLAYYLPGMLFVGATLVLTVSTPGGLGLRIFSATAPGLLLFAAGFAFLVGGSMESALLIAIARNCLVASVVILFPWNRHYFNVFAAIVLLVGSAIGLRIVYFYLSSGDYSGDDESVREGYLNTSLVAGMAAICALYFVVGRMNALTLAAFFASWFGLVMGQGRGATLFAGLVSVAYLLVVMRSRLSTFDRSRKLVLLLMLGAAVPALVSSALSIGRNAARFERLFTGEETSRQDIWESSWESIQSAPLIGHGLGAYFGDGVTPHNIFMQYAQDGGLVAVLLLLLYLLVIYRSTRMAARIASPASLNQVYCAAALAAYVFLNFQKSYDAYLAREIFLLTALPIGIGAQYVVAMARVRDKRKRRGRRRRRRRRLQHSEA